MTSTRKPGIVLLDSVQQVTWSILSKLTYMFPIVHTKISCHKHIIIITVHPMQLFLSFVHTLLFLFCSYDNIPTHPCTKLTFIYVQAKGNGVQEIKLDTRKEIHTWKRKFRNGNIFFSFLLLPDKKNLVCNSVFHFPFLYH